MLVPRSAIHVSHSILVGPYPCRLDGAVGATMPLLVTAAAPRAGLIPLVAGTSLMFLALLGGLAARVGGAGVAIGAIRVTFWGALAMVVTAGIGWLFGTIV
jgi:VIT1/CCC1 family predicted Fe2+/Mn2+ transporter